MFDSYKRATMNKRINAGVAWLDGYFGRKGWMSAINTQRLDLSSSSSCVIGQAFVAENQTLRDNFELVISQGKMSREQAHRRGFYLYPSSLLPWEPINSSYSELTHLWLEKIGKLRMEAHSLTPSPAEFVPVKDTKSK